MTAEKICSECKKAKPLDEFPKDPSGKHGCLCRSCAAQYAREWRREYYRTEKRCSRCKEVKPIGEFTKDKSCKDGKRVYCRLCWNEYKREWIKEHPKQHRETRRKRQLMSKYGITPTDYNDLLQSQNNVCAVCGQPCPTGNHLAVDHDHKTGKMRGLLCVNCNMALGYVQDDPDLLRKLADYLENHKGASK